MNLYTKSPTNSFVEESDEALCALVAGGDRLAEEVLITRYHRLVRAITRPYFLAGGDSDDLLQEGMMGLMKAVREFDCSKEASFRTFAEVCIRNRMFSALRAAAREKHSPLNQSISLETPFFDSNAYAAVARTDSSTDPEELMILREKKERDLVRIKEQLSPLERKVLERYLEGKTHSEIAAELGKSSKSVENAVQRIRRKAALL
ncbi:MAG: sigma-70 family RNA polymerase sigma factor [Oscillospiraceae bacterium]|nr:sigma-70 family RNA polymerase sigma factor [Oscillospiraceae bacterium]